MPHIRPISDALAIKARDELFEVPERMADDIETIRSWLQIQPHLKSRDDDQFIIMFLRGCKYSLERTKEKLDMFYTMRTAIPEFYAKRDPHLEINLHLIRLGLCVPLPMAADDDNGTRPRLILNRLGLYDPKKITIDNVMRIASMINDILMLEDDQMIIAGQMFVFDFSNMTVAHFLQYHPVILKKIVLSTQEGLPLRQKGYHFIHTPYGFDTFFGLVKGVLNEKLRTRLHVHAENMESLFDCVPQKLLPQEYGGDAGPIQCLIDQWEKKIIAYSEYFFNEEQYGCDESKRFGGRNAKGTQFGVGGSFRKLDID